eukprot:1233766-Lingulodinium_polyedra.AAC.1
MVPQRRRAQQALASLRWTWPRLGSCCTAAGIAAMGSCIARSWENGWQLWCCKSWENGWQLWCCKVWEKWEAVV